MSKDNSNQENKSVKLGPLNIELLQKLKGSESLEDKKKHNLEMQDLFNKLQAESEEGNRKSKERYTVKNFEPINFNFLELSFDDIKKLSSNDLLKLLSSDGHSGEISPSTLQLISNELLMRQIQEASRPHWTVTPTFIVGCIASVLAAISIGVTVYFSVYYKSENNNQHADQGYAVEKNSSPK